MQADHAELTETGQTHCLPMFLIFNLFALEALHIAECLCVPCLALSPCLVPYTFPTSFPRRFKKAWPGMYDTLHSPSEGNPTSTSAWRPPLLHLAWVLLLQLVKQQ